ncbi:MAG: Rieske 2Fe-2S domain-containing protein [Candidatus Thiodiazotropha sp. (ex Gloverina cf. vestifex)]|nr:Rieske 2Fe-2S domain-containing protein [Candidatus Thiodiazotropha sp. (ex Gloverina cf. vestifex)]
MAWVVVVPEWLPLPEIDDLPDPGSRGVTLELSNGTVEVILLQKGGCLFAYRNRCPHTGVNLEWQPDRFLDFTDRYIQCATHGALFRIEDGYCLRGPCAGQHLNSIPLRMESGRVFVMI